MLISVLSVWCTIDGSSAQFRKFCTHKDYQRQGFGTQLLEFTFQSLSQKGIKRIWCNARQDQIHFYSKKPFLMSAINGTIFIKEKQRFIIMERLI